MGIKLLSDEIINQIAAGEVIENPSAIIKELIENSIDAKSTQIDIEIENAGLKKIVIKDNGIGISKNDLLNAPKRHATSKIRNFEDLYHINSMGFRGEALASIFSVAKTKIISKQKDKEAFEINSSDINKIIQSSGFVGTTIIVEDLFYNTPVRKKYLKSENIELKNILDIVKRFLISYKNIKFTLKHNSKSLINKPILISELDNIYYLFEKEIRGNLLEINFKEKGIKINGFIGNPSAITYSNKKNQYLFVNKRFIKSKLIKDAIYEGFSTNLMEGRNPFFVLFIEIDPEIIDVNIHPSKIEIKFENELEIYLLIKNAISKVFSENIIFKQFSENNEKDLDLNQHLKDNKFENNDNNNNNDNYNYNYKTNKNNLNGTLDNLNKSYFTKETQKPLYIKEKINTFNEFQDEVNNENFEDISKEISTKDKVTYGPLYEKLKEYRIIGQVNKTFIIIEVENEMIIIDQHVAEEKFYFEKFKLELKNKKISSQTLLNSEVLSLTKQEMLLYKENFDLLQKLGFKIEEFGENEIIIREVPIGINKEVISPKIIIEILYEISIDNKFKLLETKKIEKLASMACKKSIKAGHEMTIPEIHKMIENLKKLKEPFNCPHGRPILLNWSFKDLEKKFKRIV